MTNVRPLVAGRTLPHSLEAEAAVLSTILTEDKLAEVQDVLPEPEAFHVNAHERVYRAALEITAAGGKIDVATVANHLGPDQLRAIGGLAFLSTLISATPAVAHVRDHARIVADKSRIRQLIDVCQKLHQEALAGGYEARRFLVEAAERVSSLTEQHGESRLIDLAPVDAEVHERLEAQWDGKREPWGMQGCFPRLHALTHGYGPGEVTFLGSDTGGGKTAFAIQEALELTSKPYGRDLNDRPLQAGGVYITLEMPRDQIYRRALMQQTWKLGPHHGLRGWSRTELATGRCDETGEMIRDQDNYRLWLLEQAREQLRSLPLWLDDAPQTIDGIRSVVVRARSKLAARGAQLRLVVLDHLHLVDLPDDAWGANEVQALAKLAKSLKEVAKTFDLHVLALAQYKREAIVQQQQRKPIKQDIRGAAAIEQIADKIALIHRPWTLIKDKAAVEPEKLEEEKRRAEIIVDKHRDGSCGSVEFQFFGERVSFAEK